MIHRKKCTFIFAKRKSVAYKNINSFHLLLFNTTILAATVFQPVCVCTLGNRSNDNSPWNKSRK